MFCAVRYKNAVCLNLLIFAYIAESFVLLTANVEDIKQIAKKFLSDTLTDQISDFISKTKLQDALSEENEKNAHKDINSRDRDTEAAAEIFRFDDKYDTYGYNRPDENDRTGNFNVAWKENRGRLNYDNRVNDDQRLKIESAYVKPEDKARYQAKPTNISGMGLASSHHKNDKRKEGKKLTTEKQRNNEFDQYDNTNYERNELVATSGHLGLPRVKGFNKKG